MRSLKIVAGARAGPGNGRERHSPCSGRFAVSGCANEPAVANGRCGARQERDRVDEVLDRPAVAWCRLRLALGVTVADLARQVTIVGADSSCRTS